MFLCELPPRTIRKSGKQPEIFLIARPSASEDVPRADCHSALMLLQAFQAKAVPEEIALGQDRSLSLRSGHDPSSRRAADCCISPLLLAHLSRSAKRQPTT